ncbi:ATP-binding protein [Ancylomarina salipaludis]|uniref:ATP-binding protein n=1 Tax=Ancylomarina salipaludis TaxID=2501299 RepID=A0A4Q1JRW1_9BACT|nr:ATP-binding protein [Ancylomarina salipaludis]RXQ97690.1 ATP-binding protein [Ancylomarina salipaludis]
MEINIPKKLTNNYQSYLFFTELQASTKQLIKTEIVFNFQETKLIESNLFAVIGSLIMDLERRRNKVRLINFQDSILNLFYTKKMIKGGMKKDVWKSLIKCQFFLSPDEEQLTDYLENKIFPERPAVALNPQLKMAIELCVAEIFRNAFAHSNRKEVFISHYVSVHNKKLIISIVNKGANMQQLATSALKKAQNGMGAIKWAVDSGTTSKPFKHNGMGLFTIRQFIEQNDGKIQIISGNGVWKQVKHRKFTKLTRKEFPGTIVTLEFNV